MPAAGKKKAAPKAHKLAEPFPKGSLLKDLFKKEWKLGSVIGQGGFGLIYLASQNDAKGNSESHVIKIEPKSNGPLFCEMTFYQRVAKPEFIQEFIRKQKLQYLPVPPFIGTGAYQFKSQDYRFLVMPRFGTDLQKLLVEAGGIFPARVAFAVGLRMIDALQFMHEHEYVHADIKAANILQGFSNGKVKTNEVYLVDFGLAYRYTVDGAHKAYHEDPRKAHDGTIEFTSRDAHKGVSPSRRADMEILGYCLLQWLSGRLPWEDRLARPQLVAQAKEGFFQDVSSSVGKCFSSSNQNAAHANTMKEVMNFVKALKYEDVPNYTKIRNILKNGLTREGQKNEWVIDFDSQKTLKRKSLDVLQVSPAKKTKGTPRKKAASKPAPSSNSASPKENSRPKASSSKKLTNGIKESSAKNTLVTPLTPQGGIRSSPRRKPASKTLTAASSPPSNTPLTNPLNKTTKVQPSKKRVVKRKVGVLKADSCAQTSPGLKRN